MKVALLFCVYRLVDRSIKPCPTGEYSKYLKKLTTEFSTNSPNAKFASHLKSFSIANDPVLADNPGHKIKRLLIGNLFQPKKEYCHD